MDVSPEIMYTMVRKKHGKTELEIIRALYPVETRNVQETAAAEQRWNQCRYVDMLKQHETINRCIAYMPYISIRFFKKKTLNN